jgi:hypothetical protein
MGETNETSEPHPGPEEGRPDSGSWREESLARSRREAAYLAFIRRRSWLIAIVLTLLGGAVILPLVRSPLRLLAILPLGYVAILLTIRLAAGVRTRG